MLLPSSLATLIAFLLLVAPGLLADLLEAKQRAGAKESSFREFGRVALFSLACSAIGSLIVGAVLNVSRGATGFDALRAVQDADYAAGRFWWSVASVGLVSVAGCMLAVAIQWVRFGSLRTKVRQVSAWSAELGTVKGEPESARTDVMVELLTGERYVGALAGFTPNMDLADRELTLAQPMWVRRVDEDKLAPIPERYERLVLRGDQIKAIAARKWIPPSAQQDVPRRPKLRVRLREKAAKLRASMRRSPSQTP